MNKEEVQKRVLRNGEPLSLELFTWDESTRTFASGEDDLVIDFADVDDCIFYVDNFCHISAWRSHKIYAKNWCSIMVGECCEVHTESYCILYGQHGCLFRTGSFCTFNVIPDCRIKTSGKSVALVRNPFQIIQINDDKEVYISRTDY